MSEIEVVSKDGLYLVFSACVVVPKLSRVHCYSRMQTKKEKVFAQWSTCR